nr:hypothetical protein Q903MT_gene4953 [Picea sitchensis]
MNKGIHKPSYPMERTYTQAVIPLFHCIQYQSQEVPCYNNAYTLLRGNKAPPQPPSG